MVASVYPVSFPPTWAVPTPLLRRASGTTPAVDWPLTYAFDPLTGDFVTDGGGRMMLASPHASAAQAAAFLVSVEQTTYPIFSRAFGIDFVDILATRAARAQTQDVLSQAMRSSARTDPRVRDLTNFTFNWATDVLTVGYILVLADGTQLQQQVWIPAS